MPSRTPGVCRKNVCLSTKHISITKTFLPGVTYPAQPLVHCTHHVSVGHQWIVEFCPLQALLLQPLLSRLQTADAWERVLVGSWVRGKRIL